MPAPKLPPKRPAGKAKHRTSFEVRQGRLVKEITDSQGNTASFSLEALLKRKEQMRRQRKK